jgi:hypothetical protein
MRRSAGESGPLLQILENTSLTTAGDSLISFGREAVTSYILKTKLKVKYSNTCIVEIVEQFVSLVLGLNQVYKLFSGIISYECAHSFVASK